jgi:UDP-2,4-diacetamido-2,4,6-trideoxy-beta-L-altropyranose hydrolase
VKIAFRVDASEKIGTGHFMRCLTLANAVRKRGAQTCFVSRQMPEHFLGMLAQQGHAYMPLAPALGQQLAGDLSHAAWLETSQEVDAQASRAALASQAWDWLMVDHYALDRRWESALRQTARKILVIDDLADRQHDCDMLLDQNFYRDMPGRYAGKVPAHCQLLLGPRFALLRDEFRELHEKARPHEGAVERLLVFFGGVDADNYTGLALRALAEGVGGDIQVDVVLGAQHPFREAIESACAQRGYSYHLQTTRMAELMAAADLAIGAAGSTSWERCCLALPAIVFSLADNQSEIAKGIEQLGAGCYLQAKAADVEGTLRAVLCQLLNDRQRLADYSRRGYSLVDGKGVDRVCACLSA